MQSNPSVAPLLNTALKDQLTAINQFFVHARMLRNWGLNRLDETEYKYSILAMKQADSLIQRVFFLGGLPNLQALDKLLIGESVPEILSNDLQLQTDNRSRLQAAIADSEQARDFVSRELLEELLEETEEHIDWLEAQLWLIDNSGLENYLQSQM